MSAYKGRCRGRSSGVAVEPVCNIVTLRKERFSVALEGQVHRTCNRGVGVVGCQQLQSEDSHALPSIN